MNPNQEPKWNAIFAWIETTDGIVYIDQTGNFTCIYRKVNKYFMILYCVDANAILSQPMKVRSETELVTTYTTKPKKLTKHSFKPQIHHLYNKPPKSLKAFMTEMDEKFQLTPPHIHRVNDAKWLIYTFKKHLTSGVCSIDPDLPFHLWCRLMQQADTTLNMLHASHMIPKLSAYKWTEGNFDFKSSPLAPPDRKVVIHEKPKQRESWAPHGNKAWYIGPSLKHYWWYRVYIT